MGSAFKDVLNRNSKIEKELTKEEALDLIEKHQSVDVLQWEDDDIALKDAALNSRLRHDEMSDDEKMLFPDVAMSRRLTLLYLFIRNKALQLWHFNLFEELTVWQLFENLSPPYDCDFDLTVRVLGFLKRYGYVNHGVFNFVRTPTLACSNRVIVIGAGFAGLAAARQLRYFGIETLILEARGRIGGRVSTYKKPDTNTVADLGGTFIMGLFGNPLITLVKQLKTTLKDFKARMIPVYDQNDGLVSPKTMLLLDRCLNKLLRVAFYMSNADEENSDLVSGMNLEEVIEVLLLQEDYKLQRKRQGIFQAEIALLQQMKANQETMCILKEALMKKNQLLSDASAKLSQCTADGVEGFLSEATAQCLKNDIQKIIEEYNFCEERFKEFDKKLFELRRDGLTEVFMNNSDRRKFDFLLACVESAIGAPLSSCSSKFCHLDCSSQFEGTYACITEGMSVLTDALANGLDIQTNCRVRSIAYGAQGVTVRYERQNRLEKEVCEINGDVCVCTLPLGVMKPACFNSPEGIMFDPPLPDWKRQAFSKLGCGNTCRVVLIFDEKFWKYPMFGCLNKEERAYLHLFYAPYESAVLIGVISGKAAVKVDKIDGPEEIIMGAMKTLKGIFGDDCPSEPKDAVVSRWGIDPYAGCSNSYYTCNCKGDEQKKAAAVLNDEENVGRVFFAGEHTSSVYPGTMHGAYLSGIYNAALIANQFNGCDFRNLE